MLTVYKTITWAIVSGSLVATITYVETGSLKVALVTALITVLLKTPLYALHDWIWNKFTHKHKLHFPESTVDDCEVCNGIKGDIILCNCK